MSSQPCIGIVVSVAGPAVFLPLEQDLPVLGCVLDLSFFLLLTFLCMHNFVFLIMIEDFQILWIGLKQVIFYCIVGVAIKLIGNDLVMYPFCCSYSDKICCYYDTVYSL